MTQEEHKQRHIELHKMLDELVADWIIHTNNQPSSSTVSDLMVWAHEQVIVPSVSAIEGHDD